MKKRFLSVITLASVLGLGLGVVVSCGEETPPVETDPTVYTVTVASGTGYTVTGLETSYEEGATVTFTVTPASGKEVTSVTMNGTALTENNGSYTFIMPGENVTITITVADLVPALEVDKDEVVLAEIGATETIKATLKNTTGTVEWTSTSDTAISLDVSEDTLTCTVTNLAGGTAVIVASSGTLEAEITVRASTYGDSRAVYTIYKADGTVLLDDVKGLYNAVGKLNSHEGRDNGAYVTAKGEEDKLYTYTGAYLNALDKTGPTTALDGVVDAEGNKKWPDGKAAGWYSNYQVDIDLTKTNVFNTLADAAQEDGLHTNYNLFDHRAVNFDADLFLDNVDGCYVRNSYNVWSGIRAAQYTASITNAQYISWADDGTWASWDLNFDLSDSTMIPSYNEEQGVFGQIYAGSTTALTKLAGMYFYAGTMAENEELEDGATRSIYTFFESLGKGSDSLGTNKFGADREINTETAIGEAVWDAFNKEWTFPGVEIQVEVEMLFTGEDTENPTGNYHRVYTISGYKDGELVDSVEYDAVYSGTLARGGGQERAIYGVSFTPDYEEKELPDITCGAKWTNVVMTEGLAYHIDPEADPQNMQLVAGRTVNSGNTTGLWGCDSVSMRANADEQSVFDFYY